MMPDHRRLLTRWGRSLDAEHPLPEYPRPQLQRESYLNLNGRWDYAFRISDRLSTAWDGQIVVPFSPETELSGVGRQLQPGEYLHYHRTWVMPDGFVDRHVLLHFGAVDQWCRVFVNGHLVGEHEGGYWPFSFVITEHLETDENHLHVIVQDPSDSGVGARGKQKLQPGGIWYTAQSGIWQTVWLESVPQTYVTRLQIEPDLDRVDLVIHTSGEPGPSCDVDVLDGDTVVARAQGTAGSLIRIPVPDPRPWSPENPFLYDLRVRAGTDEVRSYVGLRRFGVAPDGDGVPRLQLNGQPYFHAGVLDQGYWPDGLYTAPSDEAFVHDIATMKDLGFTMLRKHIKIEPLRWYYHCDRLGMLVWQDMVNGGGAYHRPVVEVPALTPSMRLKDKHHRLFARDDAHGREQWLAETARTVDLLRNCVSVAVWVPFNEGWGQFDANAVAERIKRSDPSREVDHASGWHDQGGGDFTSLHVYFRPFRVPRRRAGGRVVALSEYGGYSLHINDHSSTAKAFGYRRFGTAEQLLDAFRSLHTGQILPAVRRGLSATVYTQLSDVEDETNGLLTFDRRILKIPADDVRAVIGRLRLETGLSGAAGA
ncbi:MAG: glycoside hydrolase family 2 TIM barrel-domain containing protein [Candidatus Nanopelagicales bacterium]